MEHPFTETGFRFSGDRFGWPVERLGAPRLDYADGDPIVAGTLTPHVGPAMTVVGNPATGGSFGRLYRGNLITATRFLTNQHFVTATPVDPGATDDIVLFAVVRRCHLGLGTIISTRNGNDGWQLYETAAAIVLLTDDGPTNVQSAAVPPSYCSRIVIAFVYENGVRQRLYINGELRDTDSVAAQGSIASGLGIAINARPDGIQDEMSCLERVVYYTGNSIADIATEPFVQNVADYVIGAGATQGPAPTSFVRGEDASHLDHTGVWQLSGIDMPRAGGSDGLICGPARTNEAYHNMALQAGDAAAALAWTGAVAPTVVDDTAALLAAGALQWGPGVFEYANTTGVTRYIRMSAQTGDVNPRSLQCLVRRAAGAGAVNIGLYDESAGTFVAGAAIHDGYDARTLVQGQVPTDTDCTLCLEVADGTTVRWAAHQMETGPRATYPIPNPNNAATVAGAPDVFTSSHTPADVMGSVELTVTPLGWSGAEAGVVAVLFQSGVGAATLHVTAGVWQADIDGTTTLVSAAAPADGVAQRIRLRWYQGGQMSLEVDGVQTAAPYDGTLQVGGGTWQLAPSAEIAVRDFRAYRTGSG